jgi:hypothetical protein
VSTATKANPEVEQAEQIITDRRAELEAVFERRNEEYKQRVSEHTAAENGLAGMRRAQQTLNGRSRDNIEQLRKIEPGAMLAVIGTAAEGGVDLEPLGQLETLRTEQSSISKVLDSLARFFVPEAEELVMQTEIAELLADAERREALADQSAFELELKLIPIAAAEGGLKVDESATVGGTLREEASKLRVAADGMRKVIEDLQKRRKEQG